MGGLLALLAILSGVGGAVLHAVNASAGRGFPTSFWLLSAVGAVAFGAAAAGLVRRGGAVALARLTGGIGAGQGLSLLAREYAVVGPLPGDGIALWLGSWVWAPAFVSVAALLPLVLPDGRLPSRRWRPALALSVVTVVAQAVLWAVTPYDRQDVPFGFRALTNPVGVEAAAHPAVVAVLAVVTVLAVLVAVSSSVYRWRTAAGERRQRLKWLALGATASVVLAGLAFATPQPLGEVVAAGAMVPLPAAVWFASGSRRMWDVDLVISWALQAAVLAAVVIAVHLSVVELLPGRSSAALAASAAAATVVLWVDGPVQRWVNEWVHGEEDDPATALGRLGDRLAATSDPADVADRLLPDVVRRVAVLLQAPYAAVALPSGDVVAHGVRPAEVDSLPLRLGGVEAGTLEISRRERSRVESRLLDRLAGQAAVAVHAVLLAREARESRQAAVTAREEERRRLRHDLHDGLGPVLAALALHAETARDLIRSDPPAATALLDRLVPRLNGAVDDVRALVHDLRPPTLDELGLAGALRELASRFADRKRAVTATVGQLGPLPAAVELAAYRIAAEALANSVRHGNPSRVEVVAAIEESDGRTLRVVVEDDGRGIRTPFRPGVGLASMRRRAEDLGGRCVVGPTGRGGTRVVASLPLVDATTPEVVTA